MRAALSLAAGVASLLATPALATDIVVKDFVGKITVNEGAPDMDVKRSHPKLDTSMGETIRIDGGIEKPYKTKVCDYGSGLNIVINGRDRGLERRLEDYPNIELSVPEGASLTVENSWVWLDAEDVTLARADLDVGGCMPLGFGDILEADISKSGSGDITAGQVGSLTLSKSGSGDVEIDDVGTFKLSQSGSGELDIGRVGVSADIKKSGSGDVEIGEITGPLTISKSGSGDVDVGGGMIPDLSISKSGSGDVDIAADVVDADLRSSGSGDIDVVRVTGDLVQRSSGSSEISVGSRD